MASGSARRRATAACALLAAAGAGCGGAAGTVAVSGQAIDVERFVFARLGRLRERFDDPETGACATQACAGAEAEAASRAGGVTVSVAERADVAPAATTADGAFAFAALPARQRLHLLASKDGLCASQDGIGLEFPETDVTGYPVGVVRTDGFVGALADSLGEPVEEAALVVFLLMDAAPFPDGEILRDAVTVDVQRGGSAVFGGWDPVARRLVLAPSADGFVAPAFWLGLVAVTGGADGTRVVVTDHGSPSGRRPAFFLQYNPKPERGRCVFYFLRAFA